MSQRSIQKSDVTAEVDVMGDFVHRIEHPMVVKAAGMLHCNNGTRRHPRQRQRRHHQQQNRRPVPLTGEPASAACSGDCCSGRAFLARYRVEIGHKPINSNAGEGPGRMRRDTLVGGGFNRESTTGFGLPTPRAKPSGSPPVGIHSMPWDRRQTPAVRSRNDASR